MEGGGGEGSVFYRLVLEECEIYISKMEGGVYTVYTLYSTQTDERDLLHMKMQASSKQDLEPRTSFFFGRTH